MFVPLSAAAAGGLAAAAGERVGLGAALCAPAVGDAAATVCVGVSERVAVATALADGVAAALDAATGEAGALGADAAPLNLAHAFVSCVSTESRTARALVAPAAPAGA